MLSKSPEDDKQGFNVAHVSYAARPDIRGSQNSVVNVQYRCQPDALE